MSGIPLWPSRDPIGEEGGINLYGFGPNTPINGVDYLGMSWMWDGEIGPPIIDADDIPTPDPDIDYSPVEPDSDGDCPDGYIKDTACVHDCLQTYIGEARDIERELLRDLTLGAAATASGQRAGPLGYLAFFPSELVKQQLMLRRLRKLLSNATRIVSVRVTLMILDGIPKVR